MSEEIPQWARKVAQERIDAADPREGESHGNVAAWLTNLIARLIAAHEQPPVDPALAWARELIADAVAYGAGICVEPERKRPPDFRSGDCDAGDLIARAVDGYRKHKEAGK